MRKWLAYIGIIVALVVGYDYLYSKPSTTSVSVDPTTTAPSVPATPLSGSSWAFTIQPWMWVLGILLLIGLVIWNRRALFGAPVAAAGAGISISLPKTGSLPAQLFTSFLVFALVLYALWGVSPNADLFTTVEGWVTIAIYCVAMTAAALAAVNFKGWAKLTPVIGLFIFFSLTGFHSWMLLNSDGVFEKRTHIAEWFSSLRKGNSSGGSLVASPTTSGCDGQLTVYTYSPGYLYNVNKNTCQVRAYIMQGCVEWFDASMLSIGRTCTGGTLPFGIKYMKPQSEAVVRLNHCRNYAPGVLVDACA